jgi:hypothetical protein
MESSIDKISKKLKNEISSRSISSRGGERDSQDSYIKKPSKVISKGESYGTIIQMIKSDIFQIQETINDHSNILRVHKICTKSQNISRKIAEIEEHKDIKTIIEKISQECNNLDNLSKLYSCNSKDELIQKLAMEVNCYDLFLKKINDLFFIINLKVNGEENLIYQDTFSKFFLIKLVLDKIGESDNNTETQPQTYITSVTDGNNHVDEDLNKVKDLKSLSAFIEMFKNTNNPIISNIINMMRDFLEKLNLNYTDMMNKYGGKKVEPFDSFQIEKFMTQKLLIEKILAEKDKDIADLTKEIEKIKKISSDVSADIKQEHPLAKEPIKHLINIIEESINF